MSKKQTERLLEYFETSPTINPLESWTRLGIYRLGARIFDLRNAGHQIDTEKQTVYNQFGEKCRVATYRYRGAE